MTLTAGLKDAADTKDKGLYVTLAGKDDEAHWTVFDPNSTDARRPTITGVYRPHFAVERSLAWPEALRRSVEADMVASAPLAQRWVALKMVLRPGGYEVFLDGIPLAQVTREGLETQGFLRLNLTAGVQLAPLEIRKAAPADARAVFQPVSLQSILNASRIDGQAIDRGALSEGRRAANGRRSFLPRRAGCQGQRPRGCRRELVSPGEPRRPLQRAGHGCDQGPLGRGADQGPGAAHAAAARWPAIARCICSPPPTAKPTACRS